MTRYTAAMTSTGQVTLPKELRVFLGVDGAKRITFERKKDEVVIKKKMSYKEFRAELDKHITPEVRRIIKEDKKKGITTVRQMREEIAKSPAEKKRLKEEYGPAPNSRYA